MKRLLILMLAASMLAALAGQAAGEVEFSVSGEMEQVFVWGDKIFPDLQFSKEKTDHFYAAQRARFQTEITASENLRGVVQIQVGTLYWGSDLSFGNARADAISLRRAYVQWNIPGTPVEARMGIQSITLPHATFGNPVFDEQMPGVHLAAPLNEHIALNGFWGRVFHDPAMQRYTAADVFGLTADLSFEQFRVSPWLVYARIGSESDFENDSIVTWDNDLGFSAPGVGLGANKTGHVYVAGTAVEIFPLNALSIRSDLMFGATSKSDSGKKTAGYLLTLAVDYEMPWGTPGVFGWYASGSRNAVKKYGALPVIGTWGGFYPTRMAFPGAASIGSDSLLSLTGQGTAGLGLQIADLSFVEKLNHTVRLAYIRGTNKFDTSGLSFYGDTYGWMHTQDRAWEFDVDTTYQLYENLAAYLELGMLAPSFKEREDKAALNAQLTFIYSF